MNVMNPALTAAQSVNSQQNGLTLKSNDVKMDDKSSTQQTGAGNSTVTLSEEAKSMREANGLVASQTVRENESVEVKTAEANQTSAGLSRSSTAQDKIDVYTTVSKMGAES